MKISCAVLGGGSHAKVVIDTLSLMEDVEIVGILDSDACKSGGELLGVPILGDDSLLDDLASRSISHFIIGLAGIGPTPLRRKLFQQAVSAGLEPLSVVHPSAIISGRSVIGPGVQVLAGAIVNADARIAEGCIVNTGAIIEHDVVMDRFAHAASGCRLAGGVHVEPHVFIGAGATVIQGVTLGEASLVGAGSVVLSNVPAKARAVGVPARILDGSSGS